MRTTNKMTAATALALLASVSATESVLAKSVAPIIRQILEQERGCDKYLAISAVHQHSRVFTAWANSDEKGYGIEGVIRHLRTSKHYDSFCSATGRPRLAWMALGYLSQAAQSHNCSLKQTEKVAWQFMDKIVELIETEGRKVAFRTARKHGPVMGAMCIEMEEAAMKQAANKKKGYVNELR